MLNQLIQLAHKSNVFMKLFNFFGMPPVCQHGNAVDILSIILCLYYFAVQKVFTVIL